MGRLARFIRFYTDEDDGNGGGKGVLKTVTGALLHITDALAKPLKKLVVNLEPVQSGSGDPSPENVRPITGWTGANVVRTGKNLLVLPMYYRADTTLPELFFLKAGDYYLSYTVSGATSWRVGVWMKDKNGNNLSDANYKPSIYFSWYSNPGYWLYGSNGTNVASPIHIEEDCYVRFFFGLGDTTESTVFNNQLLELGNAKTTYEAPIITTIPLTFPDAAGTVYGGTLTNEGGEWKLRVDRAMVDMGTLNYSVGFQGFYTTGLSSVIEIPLNVQTAGLLSSQYVVGNTPEKDQMYIQHHQNYVGWVVFLPSGAYDSAASFKTAMSGVQLVYKLATPIEYTLTESQALTLLQGENNIWCDASDSLELTYYAKAEETP